MNTVQTLLACDHWYDYVKGRVRKDQSVICPICKRNTFVVLFHVKRWHVRCQTMSCRYSRWFGQDRQEALTAANRHATSTGHIDVPLMYDTVTKDGKGVAFNSRYAHTKSSYRGRRNPDRVDPIARDKGPVPF